MKSETSVTFEKTYRGLNNKTPNMYIVYVTTDCQQVTCRKVGRVAVYRMQNSSWNCQKL